MKNPFGRRARSQSPAAPGAHHHGADHPDWCACTHSEEERRRIAEFGWLAVTVPAGEHDLWDFHYTAGLTDKGLPELIVYGLPGDVGGDVLNLLASRLVEGEVIRDGDPIAGLLEADYAPQLRTAVRRPDPLGVAEEQYGDQVTVRQLVLPDRNHRMPWHPGFDESWAQPVLYAWAPVEVPPAASTS